MVENLNAVIPRRQVRDFQWSASADYALVIRSTKASLSFSEDDIPIFLRMWERIAQTLDSVLPVMAQISLNCFFSSMSLVTSSSLSNF